MQHIPATRFRKDHINPLRIYSNKLISDTKFDKIYAICKCTTVQHKRSQLFSFS